MNDYVEKDCFEQTRDDLTQSLTKMITLTDKMSLLDCAELIKKEIESLTAERDRLKAENQVLADRSMDEAVLADRYKGQRDELIGLCLGLEQFYKRTGILSFDDIDAVINKIKEADK